MKQNKSDLKHFKNWRPFIKYILIVVALIVLASLLFGIWRFFMPGPEQNESNSDLTGINKISVEKLEADVQFLSDTIGQRNIHTPGSLEKSASWIEERMNKVGYKPDRHTYQISGLRYGGRSSDNIIAESTGSENPGEIVIVGAHYDTVYNSPGANDNASAVAVLFSLAEWFSDRRQSRTIRFVAFVNEEPPFFHSSNMGSYTYARKCRDLGENITAMMALDGLGYFSDKPGSQSYPLPGLGFIYPKTADFIAFVTRVRDSGLLRSVLKSFREQASVPAEGAALPGFVPGVYWSDHWSFWKHGFPAFLVTDTLLFRDPAYHTPQDTPDRLDYNRMAFVAGGLISVVEKLASQG